MKLRYKVTGGILIFVAVALTSLALVLSHNSDCVPAPGDRALVLKPVNMTFEHAASVPIAAITALQALRDKGKIVINLE